MNKLPDAILADDGADHPLGERSGYGAQLSGNGEPGRRSRVMHLSLQLLRDILKLPESWEITATADDPVFGCVKLRIESPDFPQVPAGTPLPTVTLRYRMDHTRVGDHTEVRTVKMVGWE